MKIRYQWPEIKLDLPLTTIIRFLSIKSDDRGQNQPNGGQHRSQHREQTGAAPRVQKMDTNPNFPPRRQQHAHFNEGFNWRYSPPHISFSWMSITQWPVMLLVDSIIQLAENQSRSFGLHLSGTTIARWMLTRK